MHMDISNYSLSWTMEGRYDLDLKVQACPQVGKTE